MNYTTFPVQLAKCLQIAQKVNARLRHAREAADVVVDADRDLLDNVNAFSTAIGQEAKVYGAILSYLDKTEVPAMEERFRAFRAQLESLAEDNPGLVKLIAEDLGLSKEEIARGIIDWDFDESLTDGTVAIKKYRGILGALRHDMVTNNQFATANGVTFGAFTAQQGNSGTLAVTSMTGYSNLWTGTLRFECVDETVDRPLFLVTLTVDERLPDGRVTKTAKRNLVPDKSFEDPVIGILTTIARNGLTAPIEAGDDGNIFSATTIASPKGADSNLGIFYCTVTRQSAGDTFLVEFFSDNARTVKVGRGTVNGTLGTAALSVTMNGGTVYTTTFDKAAAAIKLPTAGNADNDISWDIKTPRRGDVWTRTSANDKLGNYQTKTGLLWDIAWPTSGVTLWADANAANISMAA